jgi:hypothetical protein
VREIVLCYREVHKEKGRQRDTTLGVGYQVRIPGVVGVGSEKEK